MDHLGRTRPLLRLGHFGAPNRPFLAWTGEVAATETSLREGHIPPHTRARTRTRTRTRAHTHTHTHTHTYTHTHCTTQCASSAYWSLIGLGSGLEDGPGRAVHVGPQHGDTQDVGLMEAGEPGEGVQKRHFGAVSLGAGTGVDGGPRGWVGRGCRRGGSPTAITKVGAANLSFWQAASRTKRYKPPPEKKIRPPQKMTPPRRSHQMTQI